MPRSNSNSIPVTGVIAASCTGKITNEVLKRIRPSGKRFTIRDTTVSGLLLRIGAAGAASWWIEYRNRQGQRDWHRLGTNKQFDLESAKVEARKLLGDVAKGKDPAAIKRAKKIEDRQSETRILRSFLEGPYRSDYLAAQRSGKDTEARLKAAYRPFLDKDMERFAVAAFDKHRAERLAHGVTPQTLNRDRVALMRLLRQAVIWGGIAANPLSGWKPLEIPKHEHVRFLDDDERRRLTEALESPVIAPYFKAIVILALNTGCRRGELFGLTWSNIKNRVMTVRAHTSKGNKTRHIPLNDAAMNALEAWKDLQGDVGRFNGLLFPSPKTGDTMNDVKRQWHKLMMLAKIENFRFHDMRHDFASRLVMNGIDLYRVQHLLGHSSPVMTQKYAHLQPGHLADAVKVLK
jgi:integrase